MNELITTLEPTIKLLLPGFLAAWIYHAFSPFKPQSQFDRVINALILTFLIQLGIGLIEKLALTLGGFYSLGEWSDDVELAWTALCSVIIGLTFSYFSHNDAFHDVLRKLKLSSKTSYPSEWYGLALEELTKPDAWILLQLDDGNRVAGWAERWPTETKAGQFVLAWPYLMQDTKAARMENVNVIVIEASNVKWIEILNPQWNKPI